MMSRLAPLWLTMVLALGCMTTAQAHTFMFGGYVVAANSDGGKHGEPMLTLRITWDSDCRNEEIRGYPLTDKWICILDGKRLAPADFIKAVKPGMAYRCLSDLFYIRVYSDPGRLPAVAIGDPMKDGVVALRLASVGPFKGSRGEGRGEDDIRTDLVLRLALENGEIRDGVAVASARGLGAMPWHAVDATGLSLQDGRLSGKLIVHLQPPPGMTIDGQGEQLVCPFAIDVPVAADALGKGTYSGTVGKTEVKGTASATLESPVDLNGDVGVWVRLGYDAPVRKNSIFLAQWTFARKAGAFVAGPAVQGHIFPQGELESGSLTIDGRRFTATITGPGVVPAASGDGASWTGLTCTLEGQIIGEWFHGTFTTADGKAGHFRGELRRPDAPPAWGWSEGKIAKQLRVGEYPE